MRNIDDMSRAFGLIVRDTSTYYVIGYQPGNAVMDGKFRRIEVRMKSGDLKVRARRGYVAVALPPQETLWGGGSNYNRDSLVLPCRGGPSGRRRRSEDPALHQTDSGADRA